MALLTPRSTAFGALLFLAACGSSDEGVATTSGAESDAPVLSPMQILAAYPGPYVRVVRGGCESGPESCSVSGDCEAAPVDCGPDTDRLRITVHWASSDDLDLYVVDRLGDTVSFLRPNGLSGGARLAPGGRSCVPGTAGGTEAVSYTGPNVLNGAYTVVLEHFGSCMSGLGTVDADITVSAGGRHLATYRATLSPHDRLEVLALEIAY